MREYVTNDGAFFWYWGRCVDGDASGLHWYLPEEAAAAGYLHPYAELTAV